MIKFFKQKNKNKVCPAKPWRSRGFTLVETLVAISIFSMSIVAIMSVLGNGVSDTNYAKQKMIASYLAQEGIEYIRNMRDTYVLYTDTTGNDWDAFKNVISECGNAGGGGGNTKNCYFYDENFLTTSKQNFLVAEYIREKLMKNLGQELPYGTTVTIDAFANIFSNQKILFAGC